MDITLTMRLGVLGVEDIHLIEFLSALGTVLEHGAHRSVAVDVGVLTLDVIVLRGLEGQVLVVRIRRVFISRTRVRSAR